jgi:hypothetical protein
LIDRERAYRKALKRLDAPNQHHEYLPPLAADRASDTKGKTR